MYNTTDGHIVMTYDEYDNEEANCDRIFAASADDKTSPKKVFFGDIYFPRVDDIKEVMKQGKLEKYFYYFFYFYTQKMDVPKEHRIEYDASMKLIRQIMKKYVTLEDEDEYADLDDEDAVI